MWKGLKIKLAIGALALIPSLAHAGQQSQQGPQQKLPQGIHVVTGLRPDKPNPASHQKPKMQRIKAKAESWGIENQAERQQRQRPQVVQPTRSDPFQIVVEGVNKGTKVTVTKKGPLEAIAMPDVERLALRDGKGRKLDSAKFRKIVNRDYNKQLAANVGKARKEEVLIEATQTGESSAQPVVINSPAVLATNSKLTVTGVDPFGRKYQGKEITVEGRAATDSGWSGWRDLGNYVVERTRTVTAGHLVPSEAAQIVKANLRSTPVLDRVTKLPGYEKVNGKWQQKTERQSYVKVLGLAAFSPNSTVTVVNKRMEALGGEDAKRAAVTFQSNDKGAGDIEVPALLGDELRVTVHTRRSAEIQGSSTSMDIKIPSANQGAKFMHDRYLPIE